MKWSQSILREGTLKIQKRFKERVQLYTGTEAKAVRRIVEMHLYELQRKRGMIREEPGTQLGVWGVYGNLPFTPNVHSERGQPRELDRA